MKERKNDLVKYFADKFPKVKEYRFARVPKDVLIIWKRQLEEGILYTLVDSTNEFPNYTTSTLRMIVELEDLTKGIINQIGPILNAKLREIQSDMAGATLLAVRAVDNNAVMNSCIVPTRGPEGINGTEKNNVVEQLYLMQNSINSLTSHNGILEARSISADNKIKELEKDIELKDELISNNEEATSKIHNQYLVKIRDLDQKVCDLKSQINYDKNNYEASIAKWEQVYTDSQASNKSKTVEIKNLSQLVGELEHDLQKEINDGMSTRIRLNEYIEFHSKFQAGN